MGDRSLLEALQLGVDALWHERDPSCKSPNAVAREVDLSGVLPGVRIVEDPNCPREASYMLSDSEWNSFRANRPVFIPCEGMSGTEHAGLDAWLPVGESCVPFFGTEATRAYAAAHRPARFKAYTELPAWRRLALRGVEAISSWLTDLEWWLDNRVPESEGF